MRAAADIQVTATVRLHKDDSGDFIDATLDAELRDAGTSTPQLVFSG